MKNVKNIKFLFLTLFINCNSTSCFINQIGKNESEKKIEITSSYIKTGWLLNGTTGSSLMIQKIYPKNIEYKNSNYSEIDKSNYDIDSCYTIFAKNSDEKVYFDKKPKKWKWEKICNEVEIGSSENYQLEKNTYYRILRDYDLRGENALRVYFYIDEDNQVIEYISKPNGI